MARPSWAKRSWWGDRTRKSARSVVTASVLVTSIVLTLAPNGLVQAVSTIVLNPAQGPVGTQVTVMGTGFAPGSPPCQVRFGIAANAPFGSWGGTVVASCTVDGNGGLQATFTVPQAPVGSVTIGVCNYCNGGEFVETAKVTFNVTAPPSTTTLPPTTSSPQTTTTVVSTTSSTTTTLAVPATTVPLNPTDVPALVNGSGVPDLGSRFGDRGVWRPITVTDGIIDVPETWLDRCAAPSEARLVDFDDMYVGESVNELTPFAERPAVFPVHVRHMGTAVAPRHGTWSAPNAMVVRLPDARNAIESLPGGLRLPFQTYVAAEVRRPVGFTYFGL